MHARSSVGMELLFFFVPAPLSGPLWGRKHLQHTAALCFCFSLELAVRLSVGPVEPLASIKAGEVWSFPVMPGSSSTLQQVGASFFWLVCCHRISFGFLSFLTKFLLLLDFVEL